jgi:hypothetical protein
MHKKLLKDSVIAQVKKSGDQRTTNKVDGVVATVWRYKYQTQI